MQDEINEFINKKSKTNRDWIIAKHIVLHFDSSDSSDKTRYISNTEFFWDYLDILFNENNDSFDNITKVIYSSNNLVFEFDTIISKFIVDNLKICKYKPNGYLFNKNENNIWDFTIIVITKNNVYSANRYVDETHIGCF